MFYWLTVKLFCVFSINSRLISCKYCCQIKRYIISKGVPSGVGLKHGNC